MNAYFGVTQETTDELGTVTVIARVTDAVKAGFVPCLATHYDSMCSRLAEHVGKHYDAKDGHTWPRKVNG